MKINTRVIIPISFILFWGYSGCEKTPTPPPDNPYGLPNATQTGANIFACRVNGVNCFAPHNLYTQGGGVHNDTIGVFGIMGFGNFSYLASIGIYHNLKEKMSYDLLDTITSSCLFVGDSTCNSVGPNFDIYTKQGRVTLSKLDRVNKIISGTFDFKVPIPGCDTLFVTDGRFDMSF